MYPRQYYLIHEINPIAHPIRNWIKVLLEVWRERRPFSNRTFACKQESSTRDEKAEKTFSHKEKDDA